MRKHRFLILSLIILSIGAAICVYRWDAWFSNPPEPIYTAGKMPEFVTLTFGENMQSDRTISWRTDIHVYNTELLLHGVSQSDTLHLIPETEQVESRAGEAMYYRVKMTGLEPDEYNYAIQTPYGLTKWRSFTVSNPDTLRFVLFGDIQDTMGDSARVLYNKVHEQCPKVDFYAYLGDIIERPSDEYWHIWFDALKEAESGHLLPSLAVPGNHEYLKGFKKKLDSRWKHVFVNPENGPIRSLGTTYYVDYPTVRFVMIDTDMLHYFSDYTRLNTWLKQVLQPDNRWKIVIMHHPVYSAGMRRDNPFIYLATKWALENADIVFAGHDHNYQCLSPERGENGLISEPVYMCTTSSAKSYIPKCRVDADCLGNNHMFYEYIELSEHVMCIQTRIPNLADTMYVYDAIRMVRESDAKYLYLEDDDPIEFLSIPERYKDKQEDIRIRRFFNRKAQRKNL